MKADLVQGHQYYFHCVIDQPAGNFYYAIDEAYSDNEYVRVTKGENLVILKPLHTGLYSFRFDGNLSVGGVATIKQVWLYESTTATNFWHLLDPGNSLDLVQPWRTGYTFAGWKSSSATINGSAITARLSSGNEYVTAQWTPNKITISLNNQGGTGQSSITGNYDSSFPSLINIPKRPGYRFLGYYTSTNGNGTKYYDATGLLIGSHTFSSNMTLHAAWKEVWTNRASGKVFDSSHGNSWADAYQITSAGDLAQLAYEVNVNGNTFANKYFKQTTDISLSGVEWDPIGGYYSNGSFCGNYDGQNYKITYIQVNSPYNDVGLFGVVNGGEIKNVNLQSGNISGAQSVGGIVGTTRANSASRLTRCINMASVKSNTGYAGGICGSFDGGEMINCINKGNVSGASSVGGLCGGCSGNVSSSFSIANISSSTGSIGGLVGYLTRNGLIKNCSAWGRITFSGSYGGGLIGTTDTSAQLTACSFYGTSDQTIKLCGDPTYKPKMTACWQKCNDKIQVSSNITSDSTNWTKYWAVISNLNEGLPLQKEVYADAAVANSTAAEIAAALPNAQVYA